MALRLSNQPKLNKSGKKQSCTRKIKNKRLLKPTTELEKSLKKIRTPFRLPTSAHKAGDKQPQQSRKTHNRKKPVSRQNDLCEENKRLLSPTGKGITVGTAKSDSDQAEMRRTFVTDNNKKDLKQAGRRQFLKALTAGGAVAGLAAMTAGQAVAATNDVPAKPAPEDKKGYRETDHIRSYYDTLR